MESAIAKSLEQLIPQLGVSAIFIVVALKLYRDSKKEMADKEKQHTEEMCAKDKRIVEMTTMLANMYEKNLELHTENIKVITQLKDAMVGQSQCIERNTEALISLEKKIISIPLDLLKK